MSEQDDRRSGIPTRAIHQAYLDMQRSLKRYRQATDKGTKVDIERAHGDVQETVLTLYELLRPHIRGSDSVRDYWDGKPPSYNGDDAPDPEEGKAVLEVQRRKDPMQISAEQAPEFADAETLEEYHQLIGLNGRVRLTNIHFEGDVALVFYDAYQLGLRELDNWRTEYRSKKEDIGGFLGGTTEETTARERVKITKLKRAARELGDVAKELGFLPQSEIPDNEDPIPI